MKKQWRVLQPDQNSVDDLSKNLGCSRLLAKLLVLRGMTSRDPALRFLNPSLGTLTRPLAMAGMREAISRIHQAIVSEETIIVFGDYDTDGVTATAVLVSFLRRCGAQVRYYIPYRMTDGYGLSVDFIDKRALPAGADLIITVDCGSSSHEAVSHARRAGIDTIVTDHHPVTVPPTDAIAVVNPTRSDCPSNLNHLAGVGVAFYLIIALRTHLRKNNFWAPNEEPNLKRYCDLVALGTIADVAPIVSENRVLTATGLQRINRDPRPGVAALIRNGKTPTAPVDAETVSFQLAPRLNAAGRMAHARISCELLLAEQKEKANRLAASLCKLNSRRQSLEAELLDAISSQLNRNPQKLEKPVLVAHGPHWHEGILGIVAARLVRKYHRPAIVLSTDNGTGKGSGRSIEGIDLSIALGHCADLLDRYGGHPLAVGLSLPSSRIEAFIVRLAATVDQMTHKDGIETTLPIDARVPISDITPALMNDLERMGPFGQGNPYPRFIDDQVRIHACHRIGTCHRKLVLSSLSDTGGKLDAIHFNVSGDPPLSGQVMAIAYRPQWNYWKGKKKLQLLIEDTSSEPFVSR